MKAIIMAGGEGTRLRPLTCDCPKPMLRLMGKPLMEYAIELLKKHGVTDIAATLGYLPDHIMDYFGDGRDSGVSMRYFIEESPMGTAGSVKQAQSFLDERFIVLSGDGITDFDLSAALRFHRQKGALATLMLQKSAHPQEYGMVVTDGGGRILSFHEKPGRSDIYSDLINTGVYILEQEILEHIPAGRAYDFGHDLFPALVAQGLPVYGCIADGYWCDVGDVAAYLQVHRDALDGRIRLPGLQDGAWSSNLPEWVHIQMPVYISPGAQIEPGARIGAYSIIGDGCRIAGGAGIKRSLVMEGAQIESGAQLRGCIVGRNCCIGRDAQLFEESVVGTGSSIGRNAMLPPGVKIWPEKQIGDGQHPDSNIVWGSRREDRFVSGALVLRTPGQAARCVQACMAQMQAAELLIGRDASSVADALWHAAAAGAMAQGVQVLDAGICSLPQLRHAQSGLHCGAAMMITRGHLHILDASGAPPDEKQQRSILKLLERQDYPCPFSRVTPPMIPLGNTRAAYIASVAQGFDADARIAPRIALEADPLLAEIMQAVFHRAGLKAGLGRCAPGEIGIRLEEDGRTAILSDEHGSLDEVQRQLACAWTALQMGEEQLILPLHFTRAIEYLSPHARFMPGEDAQWLRTLAEHAPLQFRLQTDGLYFALCFLSQLIKKRMDLPAWRQSMPTAHRHQGHMDIPGDENGRLLHALARQSPGTEMGGGMRLRSERGWAWIQSHPGRLDIFAEAASMETAGELCAFYEGEIRRLMEQRD